MFEQQDELWIPLFEPDPRPPVPGPVPGPRDLTGRCARCSRPRKFEDKVALTGVGSSTIGRRLMVDPLSLTVTACLRAVDDAGLTLDDIDGLATYPGGHAGGMSEGGVTAVEEALRIRPTWISGGGEVSGPSGSVVSAMLAVASGLCRHVLCFRTVWEATHTEPDAQRTKCAAGGGPGVGHVRVALAVRRDVGRQLDRRQRLALLLALRWRPRSTLAPIALTARANAPRNPAAIYRDSADPGRLSRRRG